MPSTGLILAAIAATAVVGIGLLIFVYWEKILNWAQNSLEPWFEKYIPGLVDVLGQAYRLLDKNIIPIIHATAQAWQTVRKYLFAQFLQIENHDGKYLQRLVSYLAYGPSGKELQKIYIEEEISIDELPDDIRQVIEKDGFYKENIAKVRDVQISNLLQEQ